MEQHGIAKTIQAINARHLEQQHCINIEGKHFPRIQS